VSDVVAKESKKAVESVPLSQYSPMRGNERLRKAIVDLRKTMYGETILDEQVCVVCSATEGIYATMQAFVNPGDEVILFEPFFPWYLPAVRMAGGTPIVVELKAPDFEIRKEDLDHAFTEKTKAVIFNTPHNPTGHVATREEMNLLASYCEKFDTICISDEVYEVCSFDSKKRPHLTMSAHSDEMSKRTVCLASSSKLLSVTGYRVGWITGPVDLMKAVSCIHSYVTFCAPTPLQVGIAAGIESALSGSKNARDVEIALGDLGTVFGRNWKRLASSMEKVGIEVCPSSGGYFLVADVSKSGMNDFEFCEWLIKNHEIVAVPLSLFYADSTKSRSLVRFAVCKTESFIENAAAAFEKVKI
jgi:aspartate/methionine/tyrosine aminotransferase